MREARPITTQNPSVGLYRFATAFPGHCEHVALQQQSFACAWPVAILHLEGFKTFAKHGPSRHKTRLWAFTALPLPAQVTANQSRFTVFGRLFHGSCSGFTSPLQGNKVMIRIGGCSGELPKILVKIMDKHDKYGNMWDNIA